MKNIVAFLFVVSTAPTTLAFQLTCRYKTNTDWWAIHNVYFCDLKFDVDISKFNDVVTSVAVDHLNGKTNADVVGIRASNKKLYLFPQDLDKYFNAGKMEFIAVWTTGLKEIHQRDLAPFTNIRALSLWENDLDVIERDLLKYNPNIEYIGLGKNTIKFIDGNVFDQLNNFHSLHIDGNTCISRQVAGDRPGVLDLLQEIKEKCQFEYDNNAPGSEVGFNVRILSSQ